MKIGILKADTVRPEWVEEHGEYPDMFRRLLAEQDALVTYCVYDVEHERYPSDIDEVDAYLLTGSKRSVYEDEPWIHRLAEFVRTLHARKKTLVGICFGHQMVAHALGGKVERSAKGWGVGAQHYQITPNPQATWLDDGEDMFSLLASHEDQVIVPAQGASVVGGSAFCENAACQVGDHILTFQGHPEFSASYARTLATLRKERIGDERYSYAMATVDNPVEGDRVARWMLSFMRG
ncbi:MAG: GMP synthase [Halioglobus sp.]